MASSPVWAHASLSLTSALAGRRRDVTEDSELSAHHEALALTWMKEAYHVARPTVSKAAAAAAAAAAGVAAAAAEREAALEFVKFPDADLVYLDALVSDRDWSAAADDLLL